MNNLVQKFQEKLRDQKYDESFRQLIQETQNYYDELDIPHFKRDRINNILKEFNNKFEIIQNDDYEHIIQDKEKIITNKIITLFNNLQISLDNNNDKKNYEEEEEEQERKVMIVDTETQTVTPLDKAYTGSNESQYVNILGLSISVAVIKYGAILFLIIVICLIIYLIFDLVEGMDNFNYQQVNLSDGEKIKLLS